MIQFDVDSRDLIRIPQEYKAELEKYRRQAKKIRVIISPVFEQRTNKQNALFHKKLKTIELLTGLPWEEAKEQIKSLAIDMGYPYVLDDDGSPKLDGNGNMIPISSSDASISEMKILFTALDEWCFRNQVNIQEVWDE